MEVVDYGEYYFCRSEGAMIRTVGSQFWTDPKVKKYPANEKLLFLYLMTNNHTHFSGIYSLPLAYAQNEIGFQEKQLRPALEFLQKEKRVFYDEPLEIVWVTNMLKHQPCGSQHIKGISNHLKSLHNSHLVKAFVDYYKDIYDISYIYGIETVSDTVLDTLSVGSQDPPYPFPNPKGKGGVGGKPTQNLKNGTIPYQEILATLNSRTEKHYQLTDNLKRLINSRWADGFRIDDFNQVIAVKSSQWKGTESDKYLRPETLFGTKFDSYRNEKQTTNQKDCCNGEGFLDSEGNIHSCPKCGRPK